jgi:hypothetical protein
MAVIGESMSMVRPAWPATIVKRKISMGLELLKSGLIIWGSCAVSITVFPAPVMERPPAIA